MSGIWPTAISGIHKSTKGSHPYNQGKKHPSMEIDHDDRMHIGGLPTITVPSIDLDITVERSHSRKYIIQGCGVTSRAITEKVKGSCHHQHVLFGG
jgi:hypothetical protein